jgi:regulator of sirC expression with transglutaminase-like and TPR domain
VWAAPSVRAAQPLAGQANNMSLTSLPQPILRLILAYAAADAETLCQLECTCRSLRDLAREESLWKPLYQQRWTMGSRVARRRTASACDGAASPSVWATFREDYPRRHVIDAEMTRCLRRLGGTTEELPLFYAVSYAMSQRQDAMDVCWRLWKNDPRSNTRNQRQPPRPETKDTQNLARGLLRMLLCGSTCQAMKEALHDDNDSSDEAIPSPGERLEEVCLLVTALFRDVPETTLRDTTAETVRTRLQELAHTMERQFTEGMSLATKVDRVDEVFFRNPATRFSGNVEDYYDYRNSLLDVALQRRQAIPMTLALLYKFVCRRLDIAVEVVGLPGHIVAHLPELDRFVDVFDGGKHLSEEDCSNIVHQYGFPMQPSYLNPLSADLIVQRILNNLENCLVRNPSIHRPASSRQRAAITALRAIAGNPSDEQLGECRHLLVMTWTAEASVGRNLGDW